MHASEDMNLTSGLRLDICMAKLICVSYFVNHRGVRSSD
jgi:hypothetical protein